MLVSRALLSGGLGALSLGTLTLSACAGTDPLAGRAPSSNEIPEAVDVAGGPLTAGFAIGTVRRKADVDSFRITTTPVTVPQYRKCVAAGACKEASLPSTACKPRRTVPAQTGAPDLASPELCATAQQAEAYCEWTGGALPTIEQWELAARGSEVHRFAWGDGDPMCAYFAASTNPVCCRGADCKRAARLAVRQAPNLLSPGGLQDVLLTAAELLRTSATSAEAPACAREGGFCEVEGMGDRAIDFVAFVPPDPGEKSANTLVSYGFRCAWRASK
jgi:formylglycine-generating enzyme required for sulfatase activity